MAPQYSNFGREKLNRNKWVSLENTECHERLLTPNPPNRGLLKGRGRGGGWSNRVIGIKEGT